MYHYLSLLFVKDNKTFASYLFLFIEKQTNYFKKLWTLINYNILERLGAKSIYIIKNRQKFLDFFFKSFFLYDLHPIRTYFSLFF